MHLRCSSKSSTKPDFDFKINYNQGVADLNFTNFYLAESKRAAQRLETACDLRFTSRRHCFSGKNLHAMLALVKAMRNERLVISELVRIAIANIALTVNWEVLQSTNLTDEQLAELQKDWTSLDFIRGEENALAMERVTGEITLAKWRNSNSELQALLGSTWLRIWHFPKSRRVLLTNCKIRIQGFHVAILVVLSRRITVDERLSDIFGDDAFCRDKLFVANSDCVSKRTK